MNTNNPAYSAHIDALMRNRNEKLAASRAANVAESQANMSHRYGLITREKLADVEANAVRAAELADEAGRAWEARQESARALGIID